MLARACAWEVLRRAALPHRAEAPTRAARVRMRSSGALRLYDCTRPRSLVHRGVPLHLEQMTRAIVGSSLLSAPGEEKNRVLEVR